MRDGDEKPAELLWLAPRSRLAERLAAQFSLRERASEATSQYILAAGPRADEALTIALASPAGVSAIVLLSPPTLDTLDAAVSERLKDLKAPVLALFGTDDAASPPETGHAWRRGLPTCFQSFVYDAGADMANERPDAVAALVGDFFQRQEKFLVKNTEGKLFD